MPNNNLAHIVVVLDRSGSMYSVLDATIEGFNAFLSKQKETLKDATMTLVQFDDKYEINYENRPLSEVPLLNTGTFVPRGWTALHDAIGKAINDTGAQLRAMSEEKRPGKVVFVIQTDGAENASKEFKIERIREMVTHQRDKYSWEFVFLGANIDAFSAAGAFGINTRSVLQYNANALSTAKAFYSVGSSIANYASGTTTDSCFATNVQNAVANDSVSLEETKKLVDAQTKATGTP